MPNSPAGAYRARPRRRWLRLLHPIQRAREIPSRQQFPRLITLPLRLFAKPIELAGIGASLPGPIRRASTIGGAATRGRCRASSRARAERTAAASACAGPARETRRRRRSLPRRTSPAIAATSDTSASRRKSRRWLRGSVRLLNMARAIARRSSDERLVNLLRMIVERQPQPAALLTRAPLSSAAAVDLPPGADPTRASADAAATATDPDRRRRHCTARRPAPSPPSRRRRAPARASPAAICSRVSRA